MSERTQKEPQRSPLPGERGFWTPARRAHLTDLVEAGLSDGEIARRFRTTESSVLEARHRYGISCAWKQHHTPPTLAKLLGTSKQQIRRWIKKGWLASFPGPRAYHHRTRLIRHADLLAFLEDPAHWHRWDPERMDPQCGFRAWAREIRPDVRYLTVPEIAWRCCASRNTVRTWMRRGLLPSVRQGCMVLAREEDVARFVPPSQRPRASAYDKHAWEPSQDARLLELRATGMTWVLIAAELGRSAGSVAIRHARLTGRTNRPLVRFNPEARAQKLSVETVRAIRAEYAAGGVYQRQLAARYGVCQSAISATLRGRNWRHVEPLAPPLAEAADD